jgi:hypothetical protein
MPTLAQTLPPADLGFLRIVASLWGIELNSSDISSAAEELAESLCDAELLDEVVSTLPREGRAALNALAAADGRMPWVAFTRRFGEVREMGAGKRDREQPHLQPSSAAEVLWYRALLAKAFFNGDKGPQEFAFIPDDLFIALDLGGMLEEEDRRPEQAQVPAAEPEKPAGPVVSPPASPATFSGKRANLLARPDAPPAPARQSPPAAAKARPAPVAKAPPEPKPVQDVTYEDDQDLAESDELAGSKIIADVTYHDEQDFSEPDETAPPAKQTAANPYPPARPGNSSQPTAPVKPGPLAAPKTAPEAPGRPASPTEKVFSIPASDRVLDDACTYLAALRMGITPPEMRTPAQPLRDFLLAAGLLRASPGGDELLPEAVKAFLEAPREKALAAMLEAWQSSETFNELRQLPGLAFEGAWSNQPLVTREFLLNLLEPLPDGQWWSLAAFVRDIKVKYPDFQRPAGDYDSWFIKRRVDGVFLRGFATWDEVDGALVRYLVNGPLHWLGLLDLAAPEEGAAPTAFRSNPAGIKMTSETGKITVTSQGGIVIPRLAPRVVRYQVARFCEWQPEKDDEYRYRVSAGTLKRAREQGLKPEQLLGILRKNAAAPLPPPFVKALQRWEASGTEARVENLVVLKVARPDVLTELRASKAGRFLGEIIGPTTVVIQAGAQSKVMAALAELGLLAEE